MKTTSVRMRLLLWNIVVLALVLFGFILIAHLLIRTYTLSSLDRRLEEMGRRQQQIFTRWHDSRPQQFPPLPPEPERSGQNGGRFQRMMRVYDLQGNALLPPWNPGATELTEEPPWDRLAFQQAAAGESVYSLVKDGNEPLRVYTLPLREAGKQIGVIQVSLSYAEAQSLLESLTLLMLLLAPIALIIAGSSGLLLTNRALKPVRQIIETTRALNPDDLAQRLPVNGADEFGQLASTMNDMLARLETAFLSMRSLIERERRFTADASHELRTPLTAIRANTSLALRDDSTLAETRESMRAIDQAGEIMQHVIEDLLLLASSDSGQMQLQSRPIRAHELLVEAVAMSKSTKAHAAIIVDVADEPLMIWGDANQLSRLIVNLLDNAKRHTPRDGQITLSAALVDDWVHLVVTDTGEGISAEHLPHLCERFYRVDTARARQQGGAGLGLAICKSIVEAHGGDMHIESTVGIGVSVTLRLPQCRT